MWRKREIPPYSASLGDDISILLQAVSPTFPVYILQLCEARSRTLFCLNSGVDVAGCSGSRWSQELHCLALLTTVNYSPKFYLRCNMVRSIVIKACGMSLIFL